MLPGLAVAQTQWAGPLQHGQMPPLSRWLCLPACPGLSPKLLYGGWLNAVVPKQDPETQGGSRTTSHHSRGFVGVRAGWDPQGKERAPCHHPPRRRALPETCFPGTLPHLLIYQGGEVMACSDPHSQAGALLRHRGVHGGRKQLQLNYRSHSWLSPKHSFENWQRCLSRY